MRLKIARVSHRAAQAAPASIEQRTVQQHTSLGDSDESDEAVSPKKIIANVQRRLSSFTVLYQHPGNARINYIKFAW